MFASKSTQLSRKLPFRRSIGVQTKWNFSNKIIPVHGAGSPSSRIVQASVFPTAGPYFTFARPISPPRFSGSPCSTAMASANRNCIITLASPFARQRHPSLSPRPTTPQPRTEEKDGAPHIMWNASPSSTSMAPNRERIFSSSPLQPKFKLPNLNVSPLPGVRRMSAVSSPPGRPLTATKWVTIDSPGVRDETEPSSGPDTSFRPLKRRRSYRKNRKSSRNASALNLSAHLENTDIDGSTTSSTTDYSEESTDDELHSPSPSDEWVKSYRNHTREVMMRYPRTYMGLDSDWVDGLIQLLSYKIKRMEKCCLNNTDIVMIVLRKLKLDESFDIIGHAFGVTRQYVCQIFKKYLPFISDHLYELVVWPEKESTKNALPISFRKSFRDIESIIDCFEIEIEVPSSAFFQALTWSSYKHCNTIKYLVSITPNGIINFKSHGIWR